MKKIIRFLSSLFFVHFINFHTHKNKLCILTYHRVNDDPHDKDSVSVKNFDLQMKFLKDNKFNVIKISEIDKFKNSNKPIICITFDDGYLDNYTNARKVLLKYKLNATFFVTTNFINTSRKFYWDIRDGINPKMMSWENVKSLDNLGHEIGSHTKNHVDLGSNLSRAKIDDEISKSSFDLSKLLNKKIKSFAFPFGRNENISPQALNVAFKNYDFCCSAIRGVINLPVKNNQLLSRVSVRSFWSIHQFKLELVGFFDFVEKIR